MRPDVCVAGCILMACAPARAAVPCHLVQPLLTRLKAIPGAWVEQRPQLLSERLRLLQGEWKRVGPGLLEALAPDQRSAVETQMQALERSQGLESARLALDLQKKLADVLEAAPARAAARADAALLETWLGAEEGRWSTLPDLSAAFDAVFRGASDASVRLQPMVQEHLKKCDAAARERDKAKVQLQVALLRRLLEEKILR